VGIRHLGANRNLEALSIDHDGGLDDAAIEEIATWKHLNSLSLRQHVFLKHLPRMAYSAEALRKLSGLTNLKHLSLIGFDVPPEAVASPGLLSLGLTGDAINDATAERIAQCRGLQTLNLSRTQIGDAGLRLIAEGTALERLLLSENPRITEVGLSHLKSLPLEFLELRKMRLSDQSFQHLSHIPTLRRIDIWGGPAVPPLPTIEGMRVFKNLPRLRTLWIANFPSNENYAALADLKQLRELTFEMALTSRSDLEVLRRALPKTRIMAGTGGGWVGGELGGGSP
jgi:Leucine-rich repeat (LRR) protein